MSEKYIGGRAEEQKLKEQHNRVQDQIAELPKDTRDVIRTMQVRVDEELQIQSDLVLDFSHEDRIRKAGYVPSEAEELAALCKQYKIGQMFEFKGKMKIQTPFKTVVDAQLYINVLQDRVIELDAEARKSDESLIELLTEVSERVITLAKRTFKGKKNGK